MPLKWQQVSIQTNHANKGEVGIHVVGQHMCQWTEWGNIYIIRTMVFAEMVQTPDATEELSAYFVLNLVRI